MSPIRRQSTSAPELRDRLLVLHERLRAVGIVARTTEPPALDAARDVQQLGEADASALLDAGLARHSAQAVLADPASSDALARLVDDALAATEHNPLPKREWPVVRATLGDELTALLAGVSLPSLRRYAAGSRTTPDAVAARLHVVALVDADLAGSYNDLGIRRWWQRPRVQLAGRSPVEHLGPSFDPEGPAAADVRRLAAALVGPGDAT